MGAIQQYQHAAHRERRCEIKNTCSKPVTIFVGRKGRTSALSDYNSRHVIIICIWLLYHKNITRIFNKRQMVLISHITSI